MGDQSRRFFNREIGERSEISEPDTSLKMTLSDWNLLGLGAGKSHLIFAPFAIFAVKNEGIQAP